MVKVTGQTRAGNPLVTDGRDRSPRTLDVVYVVRKRESNESLRYSLRSLNNLPHNKVYISGYCPSWVKNVIPLNVNQDNRDDLENSNYNLIYAACQNDLSDKFVLMNDDFYIMEPCEVISPMHQGNLDERIAQYETGNRFGQAYSLIKTRTWLWQQGLAALLSYELHMPIVYNKHQLIKMFTLTDLPLFAIRPRTMYSNLYKLGGELTKDAKEPINPEGRFISVGYNTKPSSRNWKFIQSQFSRPSPYE
jgi:hypothetical protein